jgi:hypothetical protein
VLLPELILIFGYFISSETLTEEWDVDKMKAAIAAVGKEERGSFK